jgi:Holliday junction resolvase RusA-like endonuclease
MTINSICENCDYENQFLINESANSKIELRLELTHLVSLQSRKLKRDELVKSISQELSKFKWQISGAVSIQFYWYLSHYDRHESDKSADLNNLTKPILDALVGEDSLLIDDSQVKELYIEWISKNEDLETSLLRIWIEFNNDFSLKKETLFFVQYYNAMCAAFDTSPADQKNMLGIAVVLWMKRKARRLHSQVPAFNLFSLTYSVFDFHRTRLQKFKKSKILSLDEFKQFCKANGVGFREQMAFMRLLKRSVK